MDMCNVTGSVENVVHAVGGEDVPMESNAYNIVDIIVLDQRTGKVTDRSE